MAKYTFADLQHLEERCRVEAEKFGLLIPEILFHMVQSEEIYDVAARGLPGRYSHYQFGRLYEQQKGDYDRGVQRIYELVINTRPVYAYLLDGNSLIAQLLVVAHVHGHAGVFENNQYFAPADKGILGRVRAASERVDAYIAEYGRERVEDFIDACEALQDQRSYDQLGAVRKPKAPKWATKPFDVLFPEETSERRTEYEKEREDFKTRFPKQPERDLLAFIERHSRYLEDWQRDIISIIRTEYEYFIPQIRTQMLNEATAVYYHQTIVQELMARDDRFTLDDFTEFQAMNARVLHPHIATADQNGQPLVLPDQTPYVHCMGANPYLTGTAIFEQIRKVCENPTKDDKEKWPYWAGQAPWDEKRNEIIQIYDDAALVSEFITPRVCEKAKLFMRPRTIEEYKKLVVSEEESEEVRKAMVAAKTSFGIPTVEIVDADFERKGQLYMVHRHDGTTGLDDEYTRGVMPHIAGMWGHQAMVETIAHNSENIMDAEPKKAWYYGEPGYPADRTFKSPKSATKEP